MRIKRFIYNVLALTATSLLLRSASLYFNVFLKGKLGDDGIGLFTLTSTVYGFAITFASSGINLATTRLCSEALGKGKSDEVRCAMRRCITYSLSFGLSAFALLFFFSMPIAKYLLDDVRVISSLRLFAVSLPFIALSSCLSGYFTAMRRVTRSAAAQIAEQFSRIALTVLLLYFSPNKLETMCLFVVIGSVSADIISFFCSFVLYLIDIRRHNKSICEKSGDSMQKKLLSIALPVAFSSYFRSGFVTLEHLLIPWGLKKRGASATSALASYGSIQAMALPIILFPYAFLAPFCSMTVPEIAGKNAVGNSESVRNICERAMRAVLIFGIGTSGIMLCASDELGRVLYSSAETANYICLLSPLIPIMYIDTCIDAVLKGVNEQLYSMRVNIFDSALSVFLVWILVPRMGVKGYILGIFICEIINMSLSFVRMHNVVKPKLNIARSVILPLICSVTAACLSCTAFKILHIPETKLFLAIHIALFALLYFACLSLFGILKPQKMLNNLKNRTKTVNIT